MAKVTDYLLLLLLIKEAETLTVVRMPLFTTKYHQHTTFFSDGTEEEAEILQLLDELGDLLSSPSIMFLPCCAIKIYICRTICFFFLLLFTLFFYFIN